MKGTLVTILGQLVPVEAEHTHNPLVLRHADYGFMVHGTDFFPDGEEDKAREQALINARASIETCQSHIAALEKPVKTSRFKKQSKRDPFGPPSFGVGTRLYDYADNMRGAVIGFRDTSSGAAYVVKWEDDTVVNYTRSELNDFKIAQ